MYLADDDGDRLRLAAARPALPGAVGHTVGSGEGLVGQVASEGRSVRSADVRRDRRADERRRDWDAEPRVRSFLGVPLRAGRTALGVLELTSRRPDAFDPEQRGRASVFADAAALLVEQTRLQTEPPAAAIAGSPLQADDPVAVATVDSELRLTDANAAFTALVARPVEAILGRPVIAVLPALGRPRGRDALEAALHGASAHLGRFATATEGGREVVVSLSLIPLAHPVRGLQGVLLAAIDVSARARLEEELRQQHAKAVEARDRLQEVVEVVSHELRTPLTSVLGYARLLQDRPDAEPERREHWAQLVTDKARLMARLVDEVTDLARLGSARMALDCHPTDIGVLVRQAALETGAMSDRHDVQVRVEPDLGDVPVDRDRMAQVLSNLLGNAVKFWPEGGLIRVRVAPDPAGVRIEIEDAGPGVPADAGDRIFEPFYRAAAVGGREVPGTGLGLAVSRGIVEAHGGRLWHESPAGGGARFVMVLPCLTREE
jgi:PAS domain S-box-containing protein